MTFPFSAGKTSSDLVEFLGFTDLFANVHTAAAASGGNATAVPDYLNTELRFRCFQQASKAPARESEIVAGERANLSNSEVAKQRLSIAASSLVD